MTITHPAWLWLLAPWAGLVALVLRAYRPKVHVPFLDLWPREKPADDRRRAWHPPALPLLLLLSAMLAAIAALAEPAIRSSKPRLAKLAIVVDRGVTMLAGGRLQKAANTALASLEPLVDEQTQIRLLDTRGRDELIGSASLKALLGAPATAEQTQAKLYALEQRALAQTDGPVLVISDAEEHFPSDRIVICQPTGNIDNVGIVSASLAGDECIIKLRNDSPRTDARVTLTQGLSSKSTTARLAGRGEVSVCTIPATGHDLAKIALDIEDDLPDDNTAWIWPTSGAARIGMQGDLPGAVRQFATSYVKARPAGALAPSVLLTTQATGKPCEIIVLPTDAVGTLPDTRVVPDHQILRNVVLPRRAKLAATDPPPGDWTQLLSVASKTLLAVDNASRRVWIGFAPTDETSAADYIILLTNCVEFCTADAVKMIEPQPLGEGWIRIEPKTQLPPADTGIRAGLYQKADHYTAVNVPAPALRTSPDAGHPAEALARFAQRESQVPLTPWLWLVVAALIAASAAAVRSGVHHALAARP